ncbi:hypothetical protein HPP92_004916 [Vanilla planifolia]|uniref:Uncharacterized protein n=1 Tax=Vanilla planifolia TaxID=51239 RepID=A0A835RJA4_VANPL|nr:hypothetical protein HPP92_004916 [Vanilla planifolia]
MRKRNTDPQAWNPPVLALEVLSLLTGDAYRNGLTKKGVPFVRSVSRGSLEVARLIDEPQSPAMVMIADSLSERRHASKSHQTFFQLLSLLLSITYLTRHLLSIPSVNNDQFGSTLVIEFLLRWVGIMLPICLILQLVITVRNSRRTQQFHVDFVEL